MTINKEPKVYQTPIGPVTGIESRIDQIAEWTPNVTQGHNTMTEDEMIPGTRVRVVDEIDLHPTVLVTVGQVFAPEDNGDCTLAHFERVRGFE